MEKIILEKYHEREKSTVLELTEHGYDKVFDSFPESSIRLILAGSSPVGWVHLHLPESSLYSGFIFIYIAPGHRRKGIGTYVYRLAEKQLRTIGCNWWSSYPESESADQFAIYVGFDYTNTNSCLVHDDTKILMYTEGIRMCGIEDYPAAPDLWAKEYAAMHTRIGLPYQKKELSEAEKKELFEKFCQNIKHSFVLEINQKIVGTGSLFSDNTGIGSLAVDSAYSGRGYGTRLAAFLTNECVRRGCPKPCLYCEAGNDNAMHIYKKIGYVEQSRETVAIKN